MISEMNNIENLELPFSRLGLDQRPIRMNIDSRDGRIGWYAQLARLPRFIGILVNPDRLEIGQIRMLWQPKHCQVVYITMAYRQTIMIGIAIDAIINGFEPKQIMNILFWRILIGGDGRDMRIGWKWPIEIDRAFNSCIPVDTAPIGIKFDFKDWVFLGDLEP